MNLADIRSQVYDDLGYKQTPPTEVIRRLDRYANEAQRELVTMRGLARLRRGITTFVSTANSPFVVLPQAAVRIAGISERTSQRYLTEIQIQQLRAMDPGLTRISSNPDSYVVINMTNAFAQPLSDASAVFVKSDNALDTAVSAILQGVNSDGIPVTDAAILNGVTPVGFTMGNIVDIQKLFLSSPAVGNVTFHEDSGVGTEIARIGPGRQSTRYTLIQLYGTPSAAITYYADIDRYIFDMTSPGDEPYLLEDFHYLIPCAVRMKEYRKREKWQEFAIEKGSAQDGTGWLGGISRLKAYCRSVTDGGGAGRGGRVDFNSPSGEIWPASPGL